MRLSTLLYYMCFLDSTTDPVSYINCLSLLIIIISFVLLIGIFDSAVQGAINHYRPIILRSPTHNW